VSDTLHYVHTFTHTRFLLKFQKLFRNLFEVDINQFLNPSSMGCIAVQLLIYTRLDGGDPSCVLINSRLRLKCDDTRAETIFRLSAKGTSPFKSAGASAQSTTGTRGVRISVSTAGYTKFRSSVKGTGYPLHSQVSPSLPVPCVTVCHHISTGTYPMPGLNPRILVRHSFSGGVGIGGRWEFECC